MRQAALLSVSFTGDNFIALRHVIAARAAAAGLSGDRLDDFVVAVNELIINAVRHGGGHGSVVLRPRGQVAITCEVQDHGGPTQLPRIPDTPPTGIGGRGLWMARRLTDALTLQPTDSGLTATVTMAR
ncbi:ATP-binding protein [Micromonospora sp. NPDC005806]|uniref:ATP-binding protein n=1 Tax=Micromonospora sp. NPDC005806 TaxID=3364234 RepID=UPI0036C01384